MPTTDPLVELRSAFDARRYAHVLQEAEARLDEAGAPAPVRRELHRLALRAAFQLGDGDASRRHGFAALRLAHDHLGAAEQARSHNDLAVVAGADGLFDTALDHLWKAVHLREEAGEEVDGATLNNLAQVYLELGRPDEAVGLLDRAIDRARAAGDEPNAALFRANLGRAHALAGRTASAIPVLDAALEAFERLDRHDDVALTLAKLGVAHGLAGAAERAERSFERALALHEFGYAARFAHETRLWYGQWALEAGEVEVALAQLAAAAEACDGPDRLARSGVLEPLSRALEAAGRTEEALAALRRHVVAVAGRRESEARTVARMRLLELEFGLHGEQEVARLHQLQLERHNAELRSRAAQLEELSVTDPLTGLRNRRALDERLRDEIVRARRYGRPLVLALLDLDRFKEVNDAFSHDVGDRVLVRLGRLLRQQLRRADVAARWGGEEFALLFPETRSDEAEAVLDRIRAAMADHSWSRIARGLSVTVSIGAAALGEDDDPGSLLRRADRRLYAAKRAGRDQMVASD